MHIFRILQLCNQILLLNLSVQWLLQGNLRVPLRMAAVSSVALAAIAMVPGTGATSVPAAQARRSVSVTPHRSAGAQGWPTFALEHVQAKPWYLPYVWFLCAAWAVSIAGTVVYSVSGAARSWPLKRQERHSL